LLPCYVKLFQFSNNGSTSEWEQIGQDIVDDRIDYRSGCSVALSGDGTTLAVGSEEDDSSSGHVKLYAINSSSWRRIGNVITGEARGDSFGYSVSLSENGRTLAVGAYRNDGNGTGSGHVRLFQIADSGSQWIQLGKDIDGEAEFDMSGLSVSLSADGSVVAIGSPNDMNAYDQARVYSWKNSESRWEQRGRDLVGDKSGDNFGNAVSISDNGEIVAVGAPGDATDNRKGFVRVYRIVDDDWERMGDNIEGKFSGGIFGQAVSLSGDGKTLAIGDPFSVSENNYNVGRMREGLRV